MDFDHTGFEINAMPFCMLSSMIEEAGCTRRPLEFMTDGAAAGNLFNRLHEFNREA